MKFHVEYAKGVVKDLKTLPKDVQNKVLSIIEKQLAENPTMGPLLKGPYAGLRKFRVGNFRIIYKVEAERITIFVLRIRHRKDVYRGIMG